MQERGIQAAGAGRANCPWGLWLSRGSVHMPGYVAANLDLYVEDVQLLHPCSHALDSLLELTV